MQFFSKLYRRYPIIFPPAHEQYRRIECLRNFVGLIGDNGQYTTGQVPFVQHWDQIVDQKWGRKPQDHDQSAQDAQGPEHSPDRLEVRRVLLAD